MAGINVVVTDIGIAKIAGASVEEPLILEKFAVGDGGGKETELDPTRKELVNEKYRDFINSKYANNNNVVIECVLRANASITEGFYIRELGMFDKDGDLIAYAKLPEQYRPATIDGQIVTESIFNINLQIQNTDNVQISMNENVFATQDAVQRLLERVEQIEKDKESLIGSSIGIEKWFNTDSRYKDQNIVTIGVKTYALMDSSNVLNISDYPVLFKNIGAVDKGDGTFNMPNFNDGTLRHLPKGNTRELGAFEDDSFKNHGHNLPDIRFGFQVPSLADDVQGGGWGYYFLRNLINMTVYPIANTSGRWITPSGQNPNFFQYMYSSHSLGLKTVEATGEAETRMKNTSGQWYILAKVNI